jgi:hypothetical protein
MAFWSSNRERQGRGNEENEGRWRDYERDYDYNRATTGWGPTNENDWRYRRGYYGQSNDYDDWRYRRGYQSGSDYDYGWTGSFGEEYGEQPYWRSSRGYGQTGDYGTYYGSRYGRSTPYGYGRSGDYDEERYRRGYTGRQSDYGDWSARGSDYNRESGQGSYNPGWSYTEYWWTTPGPHSGRGPQGYQRSDERIKEDINERLTHHGQLDAYNIQVDVNNCEVTLKGTVDSRQAKRMAEDVVESVWGIRDVHNQLRVKQEEERQTNGSKRRTTQGVTSS